MSGYDWNKNGKKDNFDRYMDMKVISSVSEGEDSDNFDIDEDVEDLDIYAVDIEDEEYSWRENYEYDFYTDVNPEDYETEEEYLEALEQVRINKNINENNLVETISNKNQTKVYSYCKIMFDILNEKYDYLYDGLNLNINDRVIVPFGKNNKQVVGTVIAVGSCLSSALPCDISCMKKVLKLLNDDANNVILSPTKEEFSDNNIVYEDDYIKISLVRWQRINYLLLGGEALTGTFVFENKYDKRFCIYFKDITIEGFLNQAESSSIALSGKQKELKEIPFVFDNKIPEHLKKYHNIEFKVCYGRIREGFSTISFIENPLVESDIIIIKK